MPHYRIADPSFWTSELEPEILDGVKKLAVERGLRTRYFIMGDPESLDTPTTMVLEMPPGYVLRRHMHQCERCEVIIRGSLEVDGQTYGPGDVMQSAANEFYGPHIAGPEGCTSIEIFSSMLGASDVIYAEVTS